MLCLVLHTHEYVQPSARPKQYPSCRRDSECYEDGSSLAQGMYRLIQSARCASTQHVGPRMQRDPQCMERDPHLHKADRIWAEHAQPYVIFAGTSADKCAAHLTKHLTRGFATTFVGTWEQASRTHTCGHSPKHRALHLCQRRRGHFCGHIYNQSCPHALPGALWVLLRAAGRGRPTGGPPSSLPSTCASAFAGTFVDPIDPLPLVFPLSFVLFPPSSVL